MTKTFKHSGDLGDIIYSLPTIRALGGGILYLNAGKKVSPPIPGIPTKKFASKKSVDLIRPLLLSQDYIEDVRVWDNEVVDYDLDQFRVKHKNLSTINLAAAHLATFDLDESLINEQWLFDIKKKTVNKKKVVFHRSPRYHNAKFERESWPKYINEYGGNAVFIGIPSEYDDFVKKFGCNEIPFYQVNDLLEMAEIINGCELFIGNQSSPFAISEGLHKNNILEVCDQHPNCNFNRAKQSVPDSLSKAIRPKRMIHTYVTYAPNGIGKNIGWAYNNFCEMVPDNDWICFLDHDAMFTTNDWYKQLEEIVAQIEKKPGIKAGLLTTTTNRIGNVEQIIFKKDSSESRNHDIYFHRKIGSKFQRLHRHDLRKAKNLISGIVMLFPKKVWEEVGGFSNGFLGVDNDFDKRVRAAGYNTYIMDGVYTYHWYRAAPGPGEMLGWGYNASNNLPPIR